MVLEITEKQFEAQVKDLAKLFGWKYYHTWRSIHSPAGFPDVVMVRPPRLIFAELKGERGKVSLEQQEWLDALTDVAASCPVDELPADGENEMSIDVYLWRPSDYDKVVEILR